MIDDGFVAALKHSRPGLPAGAGRLRIQPVRGPAAPTRRRRQARLCRPRPRGRRAPCQAAAAVWRHPPRREARDPRGLRLLRRARLRPVPGLLLLQAGARAQPRHRRQPAFAASEVSALQDPTVDLTALEQLVSRDVALSFRLLRYINSAFFGLRMEVRSIGQALALLGVERLRHWTTLSLLASIDDKPPGAHGHSSRCAPGSASRRERSRQPRPSCSRSGCSRSSTR